MQSKGTRMPEHQISASASCATVAKAAQGAAPILPAKFLNKTIDFPDAAGVQHTAKVRPNNPSEHALAQARWGSVVLFCGALAWLRHASHLRRLV